MKNSIFGWARNEDQAHKIIDQLRQFGISDISVLQPTTTQSSSHMEQNPKRPTNPNERSERANQPMHGTAQGQRERSSFPNTNVTLKSLNVPANELKRYEENQKAGQYLIAVQSDNNEKLEKAQDLFRKEGLKDVSSTREKAKTH